MTRSFSPPRRPLERTAAWLLGASLCAANAGPLWAQGAPTPAAAAAPPKAAPGSPGRKPLSEEQRKARAREAFNDAEAKFNAGDLDAALERYRAANEFVASAQTQYKVALTLDKLGRTPEAVDAYKAFLADPQLPEKMAEQKKLAADRVAELSEATVKVTSSPPGAAITVDGTPQANPTPTVIKLKPGKHTVALSAGGFEPATNEIEVPAGGGTFDVAVDLRPVAPPAPATPPPAAASNVNATEPEAPRSKLPAYVTLGLAGAGLVVGGIFGAQALSNKSTFDDNPTTENADRAERNALISDMAFGVALTLGVTGAVLLFSTPDKPAPAAKAARLRLLPVVTPQTQGAAATFRFLDELPTSARSPLPPETPPPWPFSRPDG